MERNSILCCNARLSKLWDEIQKKVIWSKTGRQPELMLLSDWERVLYFVYWYDCEGQNGGFTQFFMNSGADYLAETKEAFREIGADATVAALDKLELKWPKVASPERETRETTLCSLSEAEILEIENLGSECDPEEESKLVAYLEDKGILSR